MITFARELLCEVVQEVQPLLEAHYQELTRNKEVVKLDPMWQDYLLLQQMGRFIVFTARDEGKLVAYSAFFFNKHLHYASLSVAQNDVFYVHPDYRSGTVPLRFLRYAHDRLTADGADKIVYHCKLVNQLAAILERMGFCQEEIMLGKFTKEGA